MATIEPGHQLHDEVLRVTFTALAYIGEDDHGRKWHVDSPGFGVITMYEEAMPDFVAPHDDGRTRDDD